MLQTCVRYVRGVSAVLILSLVAACAAETNSIDKWSEVRARAATALEEGYIYEDVGAKLAVFLRENGDRYRSIGSYTDFAERVTLDLFEIANDKHLRIDFDPVEQAGSESVSETESVEGEQDEKDHIVYCKTAPLTLEWRGDVAVVQVPRFFGERDYVEALDQAMEDAAGASVFIIDVRDNCGGGAMIVRRLSTYFFAGPTHLVSTEMRGEETSKRWTLDETPGPRFADVPVLILTNSHTFSAAESFTFGMKVTGRAKSVGEATGGGGHFGSEVRLSDEFTMFLPQGRTFDPRTGKGWEAVGILPDIAAPSADALEAALASLGHE